MSAFSNLDASRNAAALLRYLDDTDVHLSALKAYIVATAVRCAPGQPVLDVGCGVGHDLRRLSAAGLAPVGLDLSFRALARTRTASRRLRGDVPGLPVVQGDGAGLPFATGTFAAARIERVLQHVVEPDAVLAQVVRVVRPGGLLAVLEPDYSTFRVTRDLVPHGDLPGRYVSVCHPKIGGQVANLLRPRGGRIDDIVTEVSFGHSLDDLPLDARLLTQRGVDAGDLAPALREAWIREQQQRTNAGTFSATWSKILTVARCPN